MRHALEVRHPSFQDPRFYDLARRHGVAIVFADSEEFPAIDEPTANFTYARLMRTTETIATGYAAAGLTRWAKRAEGVGKAGGRLRVFHFGRQGAGAGRRAGADRAAGLTCGVALQPSPAVSPAILFTVSGTGHSR